MNFMRSTMKSKVIFVISLLFLLLVIKILIPEKYINIGLIADFTGYSSGLGEHARNGAQLAVNHINEAGGFKGRRIRLVVKDNKNDKITTSNAVEAIIKNKTPLIIGPMLSRLAPTVIEKTRGEECLVISPTVNSDIVAGIDDNFFRMNSAAIDDGRTLFSGIDKRNDKSIVLIKSNVNREYTTSFMNGVKEECAKSEINIIAEHSFDDSSLLEEIAMDLISLKPDGIIFSCRGKDAALLIQEYIKLGGESHFYGGQWLIATDIILYGGKLIEGMMFVYSHYDAGLNEKRKWFDDEYYKYYSENADFTSRYSYESIMVFYESLLKADSLNIKKIKREILNTGKFEGISDYFSFNKYGDAYRKKVLVVFEDDDYVLISE